MDMVSAALVVFLVASQGAPPSCDLAGMDSARDVHDVLNRRAVDIVAKAASDGWENDHDLARLISPSASFSLGAGDVGRPLPTGLEGARALAVMVDATRYRFYRWNSMNMPADACAVQRVSVEFVNEDDQTSSTIEFTFDQGRVTAAAGWQRGFESGPLR